MGGRQTRTGRRRRGQHGEWRTMKGLKRKCFIVTGAASGIGWACAERLIEEGARVVGSDVVEPPVGPSGPSGGPASAGSWEFRLADVTDEASVVELVASAAGFGGRIDGV